MNMEQWPAAAARNDHIPVRDGDCLPTVGTVVSR